MHLGGPKWICAALGKLVPKETIGKVYDDVLSGPAKKIGKLGTDAVKTPRLARCTRYEVGFAVCARAAVVFATGTSELSGIRRRRLPERQREPASEEQAYTCSRDCKVSLRNDVSVSTHDTPVGLAPQDSVDELIKDFGINALGCAAAGQAHSRAPSLR